MKRAVLFTLLASLAILLGAALLQSCLGGPPTIDGQPAATVVASKLAETANLVGQAMSDGVVDQTEGRAIAESFRQLGQTITVAMTPQPTDWPTKLGEVGATILATLIGVRYLPNRFVVGPQEAQALDKAAGIS